MPRHALFGLVALVFIATSAAKALQPAGVEAWLKRDIVGATLPLVEVERYCAGRVPKVPEAAKADAWDAEAARWRSAVLNKVIFRGEAARWRDAQTGVQWLDAIPGGPGYRIRKLRIEVLPGMWIPALLYEPDKLAGRVPAVLNVNGHSSEGKAYLPKQWRCINQAKRGMMALNVEWFGMGQLRSEGFQHARMNQLDLCGTSGLAPFYLLLKRSLDFLLSLEHTDPNRVAMTGLSGGGWQTIFFSSLDTRVKLAAPVAGYSSYRTRTEQLKDLGDSEQTPSDLATVVDFTHLTAMLAPRPALLVFNATDNCCFEAPTALPPLIEAAAPVYRLYGKAFALRTHVNYVPGTHNYEQENREAFYRMIGDFFYPGDPHFNTKEIPSESEIKKAEELAVAMPEKNEDFNTLALRLSQSLPKAASVPEDATAARAWREAARKRLRQIVRAKDYEVHAINSGSEEQGDLRAAFWRLQMGGAWTVPAVELVPKSPKGTAILIADKGRAAAGADAARLLAEGYRVLAVDPLGLGESTAGKGGSKLDSRVFLFPLLIAAIGDRPLGIQASQVAAMARWLRGRSEGVGGTGRVTLVSRGPRTGLIALVAAGLEPRAIGGVESHDALKSLKRVIEQHWPVSNAPEMFCFGLLAQFDVPQLAALVAPRDVRGIERDRQDAASTGPVPGKAVSNAKP